MATQYILMHWLIPSTINEREVEIKVITERYKEDTPDLQVRRIFPLRKKVELSFEN